ncbi:MAG: hypothetical protein B6I36_06260 [Desulfobacteraceae bacterium 4572_35.1]|nr:MAG: hypothetical protein B6I36_06260 [Desulfobacteraceae bacterium 4572_35.1]
MVKDLNCRTADKKPSPQQRCSNCSDLEKNNKELEEFIGRISSQLLAAEMADMELEQIFSACADPMIVIRVDGIIVRANKQMLALR